MSLTWSTFTKWAGWTPLWISWGPAWQRITWASIPSLLRRLPLGRGFVHCAHGVLPVPAPAVLEILKGVPVYGGSQEKELVTPTGASILSALALRFDNLPLMDIASVGHGAGTHELKDQPNVLRVILGESAVEQKPTSDARRQRNADDGGDLY